MDYLSIIQAVQSSASIQQRLITLQGETETAESEGLHKLGIGPVYARLDPKVPIERAMRNRQN